MASNTAFHAGASAGLRAFVPMSVGFIPWAIVTGIAMRSSGLDAPESIGMSLLVYAATAQLGALPLIASGAPLWLIFVTGMVLNLRFVIFSAAIAPSLKEQSLPRRILGGFLLTDNAFAVLGPRLAEMRDPVWRWGYYIAPSLYGWTLWQSGVLVGVFGAGLVPADWSLEFMGTIALMAMVVPMVRSRPMLLAALVGGLGAVLLRGLPLRLGLFVAIVLGIAAGFIAERWNERRAKP